MKIAIICTLYPPYVLGGAEVSISLLAQGLKTLGNDVIVITTGKENTLDDVDGICVYRLKNKNIYWRYPQRDKNILRKSLWHAIDIYNPLYRISIERILREFKPDIVNTSNLCGLSTAVWDVVHKLKIPIVHTLRDYYLLCPQQTMIKESQSCIKQCIVCKSYSYVKKRMSQKVDALVGISDFIAKLHIRFGYFKNAQKVITISNSVNSVTVNRRISKRRIGYIGRLSPEKGIEFMIEAFLASEASKSYILLLAGEGNRNYEMKLKSLYRSDKIVFVGHKKQTEFFKDIDFLIVPSLWNEPFGRVVIEAYASHCPVLMASNGGLKELQVNGLSWCFNTADRNSLIYLLNNLNTLSIQEYKFDDEVNKYKEDVIAGKYQSLFCEIVNNNKLCQNTNNLYFQN